ncbi:Hypothetical protein PBC10988_1750 [Planctomycetales bacterium 10988]|nr:Hypothetical protein PBC10988_1750 [Planctomycetales bacterium 10988]
MLWKVLSLSLLLWSWFSAGNLWSQEPRLSPSSAELKLEASVRIALQKGLRWLKEHQSTDGRWHSEAYGTMSSGVGNTALVLYAMAHLPEDEFKQNVDCYQRGIAIQTRPLNDDGLIRDSEGAADYPVYASALTLSAMKLRPVEVSGGWESKLVEGLLKAQRTEANKWRGDSADLGGWGPGFWQAGDPPLPIPANISVTAHVLETLHFADALTPEIQASAANFLSRCQVQQPNDSTEVGFYFTPQPDHPLNKAQWHQLPSGKLRANSYHSTTCDGVRAIRLCEKAVSEGRRTLMTTALTRLTPPRLVKNLSESDDSVDSILNGLYYYDAAAFAKVWANSPDPRFTEVRQRILMTLLEGQQEDGSWSNPLPWMREDDPLIATPFAMIALSSFLQEEK